MVFPWVPFLSEGVDDLANFIEIPLFCRSSDTLGALQPRRLLKIEDTDIVTYLADNAIAASATESLHDRDDDSTSYTFPNKTVKFFVIIDTSTNSTGTVLVRTSDNADTADGTTRETITTLGNLRLYTTEIIEGNFNGKFLTIENPAGGLLNVRSAVIIEPA